MFVSCWDARGNEHEHWRRSRTNRHSPSVGSSHPSPLKSSFDADPEKSNVPDHEQCCRSQQQVIYWPSFRANLSVTKTVNCRRNKQKQPDRQTYGRVNNACVDSVCHGGLRVSVSERDPKRRFMVRQARLRFEEARAMPRKA